MNGGAFDFVVKPIDLSDLEITIKKAIDNLSSFKEALKSRDELIVVRRELDEARTLQLSMLPKSIPQNGKLDIAVYMKTASEVGGDYYDFSQKNDGSLNVAIGDATGHGMKAGIMVSIMKTLFISDSDEIELEDFFDVSNRTIKSLNLGRMMMAFAMLNYKENKIKFINAAMPTIFVYKSIDKKVVEYVNQSMPLGALSDFDFNVNEFEVDSGDIILLLSDGLPELFNEKNEMFGYERVLSVLEKHAEQTPEEIIESLKINAAEWAGNLDADDDITFVVVKIK
ncbi:MAG: SpoIIE family protein phosphatase [Melioribacteraceae bacterium]|nr:SpoIIE family protein phosphatase [Melioribacteraceae bacterium]